MFIIHGVSEEELLITIYNSLTAKPEIEKNGGEQ
jgi:hypothetical protein